MPAGTIALTNNSSAATGTGTSFDTELSAGDFLSAVVGQVRYTLGIKSVDSSTGITLIRPFNGPSASGLAWTPIPRDVLVDTTAQIAADQGLVIRGFVLDKANWQQVFSDEQDITVTLPDGSQFQGPSWKKIADLLATLDVGSITEIAAQIHADAEQVATDKPIIVQAKTDAAAANAAAQQAKEGAQTANAAAQQAKTDATNQAGIAKTEADRAKAEADRAAASNPANYLVKGSNLSDLADKGQALINLQDSKPLRLVAAPTADADAVTKKYADDNLGSLSSRVQANTNEITGLKNRIGYALVTTTTNLALNSRMVLANPFGNTVPVFVFCEIFHATLNKWVTTPWISSGSTAATYGTLVAYAEGEGLVLRSAPQAFVASAGVSGTSQESTGNYATPSPIRIHVFKVQA